MIRRTKDGGAIVNGQRMNAADFKQAKLIRSLARILILIVTAGFVGCFHLPITILVGMVLIMIGWRMRTGW